MQTVYIMFRNDQTAQIYEGQNLYKYEYINK